MTKEEILAMEAGEDLDELVATQIKGEPKPDYVVENALDLQLADNPAKSLGGNWLVLSEYDKGDIPIWYPLPFSTDWLVVKQVVDKLTEQNLFCSLDYLREQHHRDGKGDWRCRVVCGVKIEFVIAKEAPEAICKAALLCQIQK